MCRYYNRYYHRRHTLIIKKKTAIINDYIDALIKDVEDDEHDKVIFITNVEGTTPDALCWYIKHQGDLCFFYNQPVKYFKKKMYYDGFKFVKFDNNYSEWFVELSDHDISEMLNRTCVYFIELENGETLTTARFRKELLDTYPQLRYKYDPKIDYQEQIDYINEEREWLRKDLAGTVLPTPTDSD